MDAATAAAAAAELDARLTSWIVDVAATVLSSQPRIEGGEARFSNNGLGLSINCGNGWWFSFARGVGGVHARNLLRLLRPEWSAEDLTAWASAFLAAHPGTGPARGTADNDTSEGAAGAASAWLARNALQDMQTDVHDTATERYLNSRGIQAPFPLCVGHLPNARVGEDAIVGVLHARDRTVGVQIGFLGPSGDKSTIPPPRRRFSLEKHLPGCFDIQDGDTNEPILIAEGLENALSLRQVWKQRIRGLPGISALAKLDAAMADEFIVFRDGDPPGSPADRALQAGIDHLILSGANVRVTATPGGEDANSLRQSGKLEDMRALLTESTPGELSLAGDAERLVRLPLEEYDRERMSVAKKHGVRVGTLETMVASARKRTQEREQPANAPDEELWDGPLDFGTVLDDALLQARRYIVATDTKLAALVLWSAHTHLVHHAMVGLQRSPRLAIQSRLPGSGKTTALELVTALSFRGFLRSSATASTIMRTMGAAKRTYCLDEADRQLSDRHSDMLAILDCGDRRATAVVERSEPNPKGGWDVKEFNVWGAVAFAGLDELPATLQDRSVRVFLHKATGEEVPEHLRDGTSPELTNLRRQLAAWADALFDLPEPDLPAVLRRQAGRVGDRWRPLIAIADLAGGQWSELVRAAALEDVEAEKQPPLIERLLVSIRTAFDTAEGTDKDSDSKDRLTTQTLIGALLADREEEWMTAKRGHPINPYFLRDKLRGLLEPRGAQDWWTGPEQHRQHHRGYLRLQFETAWRRYTPAADSTKSSSPAHPETSGASSASGAEDAKPSNESECPAPNPAPDASGPSEDPVRDPE